MADPPHLLDAQGRVARSMRCSRCGYNLRLLTRDSLCPECATPVAHSFDASPWRLAPARWLHRVALGVRLLWLGTLAIPAALTLALVGGLIGIGTMFRPLVLLFPLLACLKVGLLVTVGGFWYLATPSQHLDVQRYNRRRRAIRILGLPGPFSGSALVWLAAVEFDRSISVSFLGLALIALALPWILALQYIADLFANEPGGDETLARTGASLLQIAAISAACLAGLGLLFEVEAGSQPFGIKPFVVASLTLTGGVAALFSIVALLMSAVALRSYSRRLKSLAADARLHEQVDGVDDPETLDA
jgi:hypothetical protein